MKTLNLYSIEYQHYFTPENGPNTDILQSTRQLVSINKVGCNYESYLNCYFSYPKKSIISDDLKLLNPIYLIGMAGMLSCFSVKSQAPQKINYQAIARNSATGLEVLNQPVFLSVKILSGSADGSIVYQENHDDITTNGFGLFNLMIGDGDVTQGNFALIDWGSNQYWLSIDIDAGNGFENAGTMQLVAVPYALHAETVSNADDADADPNNERISSFEFNLENGNLSITESGSVFSQNLSSLINDEDSDPLNERISNFAFDSITADLTINEGTEIFVQNLSALINDADADDSNELITGFALQGESLVINETQSWSVDLGVLFNDNDPDNELISDLQLINDTILQITEGSNATQINLAALRDEDWNVSTTTDAIYNVNDNVGIGTASPEAKLEIQAGSNETADLLNVQGVGVNPRLNISNLRVGVGTDSPQSTFQINGSLGYGVKFLVNDNVEYDVTDDDHIIVVIVSPPSSISKTINLPDAATCPGRIITIRKTGANSLSADVLITFGGSNIDFANESVDLSSNQRSTVRFLSMGADGWTKLFED